MFVDYKKISTLFFIAEMSILYLTRETFNQNISEIFLKSQLIGDSWNLIKTPAASRIACEEAPLVYLEKCEQKLAEVEDSREILSFTYHIVFSESFAVPVLYLNVSRSNGCSLSHDELYSYFKLKKFSEKQDSVYDLMLTQQEHPILFKPFYFVHPCKTADWMSLIASNLRTEDEAVRKDLDNYTLTWLSSVFSAFKINLDTKYGLKLSALKELAGR